MRRILATAAIGVATLVLALTGPGAQHDADASFHLMRIHAVTAGFNGNDLVQYVELRMASNGQTQLAGKVLCFYAGAGFPFRRFTFPANVNNPVEGSSVLIGTAAMDDVWSHAPDFIFDDDIVTLPGGEPGGLPVPWPGGKVAFGTDSAADPAQACGAQFDVIDSVAYSFGGTVDFGAGFPAEIPVDSSQALVLTGELCNPCARDNSADYSLLDFNEPADYPRNNAGRSGPLVQPIMGDFDCDGDVEADDGLAAVGDAAGLGSPTCNGFTDVTCDDGHAPDDALEIFRYVAELDRLTPLPDGCAPIGDPIPWLV